jgi:hypothetical protein
MVAWVAMSCSLTFLMVTYGCSPVVHQSLPWARCGLVVVPHSTLYPVPSSVCHT